MAAGTRTLSVGETLLEPRALPPPPTRHALFVIVIVLAALVHLGTAYWGDLYSETEGQYAGAAREMVETGDYFFPTNDSIPRLQKPPLLYWLIVGSYNIFGMSAGAARMPIALSAVVTVALIFLIGERLADFWRGFSAALIYLTFAGTFTLARIVMPEPLFGAFIAGAIYCGLAGFQNRRQRRAWFVGFWICSAFACLSKGPHALLFSGGVFALLAMFYREARIRFRSLLWWPYLVLFAAIIVPWYAWIETRFNSFHDVVATEWIDHVLGRNENGQSYDGVDRWTFVLLHLFWWFPWSIAVLPPVVAAWPRLLPPRPIAFEDALPLAWAAAVLVPTLLIGQRQDYYALAMFGAFALWVAMILDRAPGRLRALGALIVGSVGLAFAIVAFALPRITSLARANWGRTNDRWTAMLALEHIPASTWLQFRGPFTLGISCLIAGALITIYLLRQKREKIAVVGIAIGMLPVGFCMIGGVAYVAPYFSLAPAARFLNARLGTTGELIFEGPPGTASSLSFYLERKFALVNQAPDRHLLLTADQSKIFLDETSTLERWAAPRPVFLIVEEDRLNHWRRLLTEHFHVYHQVATCGTYVVLCNQM